MANKKKISTKQTAAAKRLVKSVTKSIKEASRAAKNPGPIKFSQVAKELKAETKQSQKTIKNVVKSFTKLKKTISETHELSQIEKLLGEEFDTLAQARRELRKQSKVTKPSNKRSQKSKPSKTTKQSSTAKPSRVSAPKKTASKASSVIPPTKESTTKTGLSEKALRQSLKRKQGENLKDYFDRLEASSDEYKRIAGRWIYTYKGGRSKIVYGSIRNAVSTMREYDLSVSVIEFGLEENEDDIVEIRFIPFKGDPALYKKEREAEMESARKRRRQTRERGIRILKSQGIELTKTFGSNVDINEKLAEIAERLLKNEKRREKRRKK